MTVLRTSLAAILVAGATSGVAFAQEAAPTAKAAQPFTPGAYATRGTTQKDIDTAAAAKEGRPAPEDTSPQSTTAASGAGYSAKATTKHDSDMADASESAAKKSRMQ